MQVIIPTIAPNVQEAEILALLVSVGQHVRAAQPVLELEAGKSSFELPSPAAGRIEQIYVGIGDDVKVGDVVLILRTAEDGDARTTTPVDAVPDQPDEPGAATASPRITTVVRPVDRKIDPRIDPRSDRQSVARPGAAPCYVRASPAARRRARELGVDLDVLAADFEGGRVTVGQVESLARGPDLDSAEADADAQEFELADLNEAEEPGRCRRRLDDGQLMQEWPRIPHVAAHDTLEVTSLEAARRRYRDEHETAPKLTLTAFVIKACAIALRQHARMNSSLIRHGRALAVKRFVHVGFAVYTEQRLVFPVIKHADRRPLQDIAGDLEALTAAARTKTLAPEQLEGATFTVTNLRGFNGTRFTPVIAAPQVGALGLCRTRSETGRILLPVSLAYDQRVNNDAAATAFLATIAELLHDPLAMLLRV